MAAAGNGIRRKKLTALERFIWDDETLQPLAKQFGAMAVWHASVESLGHPPWLPSTTDLMTIFETLKLKQGN